MADRDELDEIREKEEDLYDDLIEPADKLRYRHPLFIVLAVLALIAVIFFAMDFFFGTWNIIHRENNRRKSAPQSVLIQEINPENIA